MGGAPYEARGIQQHERRHQTPERRALEGALERDGAGAGARLGVARVVAAIDGGGLVGGNDRGDRQTHCDEELEKGEVLLRGQWATIERPSDCLGRSCGFRNCGNELLMRYVSP